ncbi:hypothetical protein MRX96_050704 [Rhipicephalus microplus]
MASSIDKRRRCRLGVTGDTSCHQEPFFGRHRRRCLAGAGVNFDVGAVYTWRFRPFPSSSAVAKDEALGGISL